MATNIYQFDPRETERHSSTLETAALMRQAERARSREAARIFGEVWNALKRVISGRKSRKTQANAESHDETRLAA